MVPEKKVMTVETYEDGRTATRLEVTRRSEHETAVAARSACPEVASVSATWRLGDGAGEEWLQMAVVDVFIYDDHTTAYASGMFSTTAIRATCGMHVNDAATEMFWVLSDALALVDIDSGDVDGEGFDLFDAFAHEISWSFNIDDSGNVVLDGSYYHLR